MIRLIGIDIDGTLLDAHGRMPEANCAAIHDAVAAGVSVALVTGRSYPFARPVADLLPASISLIVSNGAVERDMDGGTFVRRLLDRTMAGKSSTPLVAIVTRLPSSSIVTSSDRSSTRRWTGNIRGGSDTGRVITRTLRSRSRSKMR